MKIASCQQLITSALCMHDISNIYAFAMPDWLTDALLDSKLKRHQVKTLMITMLELYTKCKSDLHLFDFFELRFKSRDDFDTLHMTIISHEHRFNCVHEEYFCVST